MVLVSDKPSNGIGILQTKLSHRERHKARRGGLEAILRGFGRFHLRHRQPRTGRNPRTGETLQIPAKAVPTFAAGKAFQDRVQSNAVPA